MHVLLADKFEQSGQDGLKAASCEVTYQPGLKDDALAEAVERLRPDVLVVRSTKVTEAILAAGALKLVVRAGAGYNTIDVAAASRRGIYVSNCPGKNSVAVAELAFALMLALDRRIADNVVLLRQGQWNKAEFSKARGLLGRTTRPPRRGHELGNLPGPLRTGSLVHRARPRLRLPRRLHLRRPQAGRAQRDPRDPALQSAPCVRLRSGAGRSGRRKICHRRRGHQFRLPGDRRYRHPRDPALWHLHLRARGL